MANFISSLTSDDLELFNKMIADTAHYSANDIIKKFNIQNVPDKDADVYDMLQ